MNSFIRIEIHIFSFLICTVMLIYDSMLSEKHLVQNKVFLMLISTTMVVLVADMLGVYSDGSPELFLLSFIAETLLFILTPVPSFLWALYVSCRLFQSTRRLKLEILTFLIPLTANAVLALANPATGMMFHISANNVYQRGPYFFIMSTIAFLPIVYSFASCIINRRRIARGQLIPMLLFALPPITAAILQILFYGISVIWASIALSIFIVYISVQARQYNLDHLTGVFNRRQLDKYLENRIGAIRKGKAFSCIMLDIDNFKSINDRFGHVAGDEALTGAAQILRSCIRRDDFLSRYAGDEFIIILNTADQKALSQTVNRIHACAAEYNSTNNKLFQLSFSVGYEIYNDSFSLTKDSIITRIDSLMYEDKNRKKEALSL